MQVTLSSGAILKALGIVNNYPAPNRAMRLLVDRLGAALDLTDDEKIAVGWQDLEGGLTRYRTNVQLDKELPDIDVDALRKMLAEPAQATPWTRNEKPFYNELAAALGMEEWE